MSTCVIVNPVAAVGQALKRWPDIEPELAAAIGPFQVKLTEREGHASQLARDAIRGGATRIIAVGGDGTISEVVNGFFEGGMAINPAVRLGIVPLGTGSDFARSLDLGALLTEQIAVLKADQSETIDLGTVRCQRADGSSRSRMFVNVCTFGLSGDVVRAVNENRGKGRTGRFSYILEAIRAIRSSENRRVVFSIDGRRQFTETIAIVGVANGKCCGGGVRLAPMATLTDGRLDAIFVGDVSLMDLLLNIGRLFRGTHLRHPQIDHVPLGRLEAAPLDPAPITVEADGEAIGQLPAMISIMPRALKVNVKK